MFEDLCTFLSPLKSFVPFYPLYSQELTLLNALGRCHFSLVLSLNLWKLEDKFGRDKLAPDGSSASSNHPFQYESLTFAGSCNLETYPGPRTPVFCFREPPKTVLVMFSQVVFFSPQISCGTGDVQTLETQFFGPIQSQSEQRLSRERERADLEFRIRN